MYRFHRMFVGAALGSALGNVISFHWSRVTDAGLAWAMLCAMLSFISARTPREDRNQP